MFRIKTVIPTHLHKCLDTGKILPEVIVTEEEVDVMFVEYLDGAFDCWTRHYEVSFLQEVFYQPE